MRHLLGLLGPSAMILLSSGLLASEAPAPVPFRRLLIERVTLFPELENRSDTRVRLTSELLQERAFHQAGDPDSLFTFGDPTPHGVLRLKAAFEVNDVVLRAIAPDLRVDSNDTRPRAAGDYRALDGNGRPYQLRLGARLVW
jgi:hypothetical protein